MSALSPFGLEPFVEPEPIDVVSPTRDTLWDKIDKCGKSCDYYLDSVIDAGFSDMFNNPDSDKRTIFVPLYYKPNMLPRDFINSLSTKGVYVFQDGLSVQLQNVLNDYIYITSKESVIVHWNNKRWMVVSSLSCVNGMIHLMQQTRTY